MMQEGPFCHAITFVVRPLFHFGKNVGKKTVFAPNSVFSGFSDFLMVKKQRLLIKCEMMFVYYYHNGLSEARKKRGLFCGNQKK